MNLTPTTVNDIKQLVVIFNMVYFLTKYESDISHEKYIDIRYTITWSLQSLKLPHSRLRTAQYPQIPTLIDIAFSTKKGCSIFTTDSQPKNIYK